MTITQAVDDLLPVDVRLHFCGRSVFVVGEPDASVGEVYESGPEWFAWIHPPGGTYMSARAKTEQAVLAKVGKRGGIRLRARKP